MGKAVLFLCGELLWLVGHGLTGGSYQMDGLGPSQTGREKGNHGLPPPFLPHFILTNVGSSAPHCEAEPCPRCGASAQLASGIKAPEERGHSHHEQGIEVDHTSPARVLTDVLQPTGCCIHLLLGRGWGTTCPTPAHSTEPEQALVEQAWCLGLGLWEN